MQIFFKIISTIDIVRTQAQAIDPLAVQTVINFSIILII